MGSNVHLELPVDHVVAAKVDAMSLLKRWRSATRRLAIVLDSDIGPKTIARYREVIVGAKTVVWNGPMGVFETPQFSAGTIGVAKAVAAVKGTTIVGGDSVAAVTVAGVADKITRIFHVAAGGIARVSRRPHTSGRGGAEPDDGPPSPRAVLRRELEDA